jgi:two-component system, NtrC family, nitrogen regulation sensor histidine kinase NtrY
VRLRWTLTLAFVALAITQVGVVMPLALGRLSTLLGRQLEARVDQLMVAADAESARLGADVRRRMEELAQSQALEDVARDAARVPPPPHVTTAASALMAPRGLDVLALLDDTGRTLSSGHLPARLGEPDDPLFAVTSAPGELTPALVDVSTAAGLAQVPAVVVARAVDFGERRVWVVGGVRLGQAQADSLARLTGAQVTLLSGGQVVAESGEEAGPDALARAREVGGVARITFAFSRADFFAARSQVLRAVAALTALGLLLSVGLGLVVGARLSRPVEALTRAARRIAAGEPGVVVEARAAGSELQSLIETFNRMTGDLKAATDRLVASERVAAWQEVARRLAHEIKNPLTPIRMSLETLLAASQRGPLDDRFRGLFTESARAVLEEVDRLKRIVDEFSQFARLPRSQLKALDLAEALQPVLALYTPHGKVTYEVTLTPGLTVLADRDQLTQVVVNLVKNAEEAMPQGGRVTVRVAPRGGAAVVEVEDQGPGIAAEVKARLFEPYATTRPHGTGLGLAIAQRITQEHSGQLEALDAPGGGALFRLTLPRLPPPVRG